MATSLMEKVTNNSGSDSNGNYCKMPDGTLIQWGTARGTGEYYFPVSFVDVSYVVFVGVGYPTPSDITNISVLGGHPQNQSKFSIIVFNTDGSAPSKANVLFRWLAIGRWK